jgi:hypothetical protein
MHLNATNRTGRVPQDATEQLRGRRLLKGTSVLLQEGKTYLWKLRSQRQSSANNCACRVALSANSKGK